MKTGKLKFHKAGILQADYTKKTSWSVPQQTAEGTVSYTNCVNIVSDQNSPNMSELLQFLTDKGKGIVVRIIGWFEMAGNWDG